MKIENFLKFDSPLCNLNSPRAHSHFQQQQQQQRQRQQRANNNLTSSSRLTSEILKSHTARSSQAFSDKDSSICSATSSVARSKRLRSRNFPMKTSKGISKKSKTMDYTNYAYNEAVGRLKMMLADNSYATPKASASSYLRNFNEDSGDNFSDNMSVIERPVYTDISKYLSPSQKSRISAYRPKPKLYAGFSSSKENLAMPALYPSHTQTDYLSTTPHGPPQLPASLQADSVQAPVEIFNFIEKQEDYIEQLEKESKYCRNELTNLLGKVKDVINENEQLTENARSELAALGGGGTSGEKLAATTTSPSSDSDEHHYKKCTSNTTPRHHKKESATKPTIMRYGSAPNIVYEARISELEAELMQANIDLKRMKNENEELKRKLAHTDPAPLTTSSASNCDTHRKQIEHLQRDKSALEERVLHLQRTLDEAKAQQYSNVASKRYIHDLVQMERSQAELEVKHLREELDRQHERVRELQHEMARRLSEERANAERRYNTQVDQLGGDLSSQWEQVAKLQLDLERQKRYETDMKRDLTNRNAQIEELKMELRSNRSTFLADMAQVNAEKQSLEQEITALRLQLDRAAREGKTEGARLNAEINSLRQRLDRGDADLLHSKREVLRLNDEIANLEKELAYGELKNEIRPTKKDLDKRISEMQEKHAPTLHLTEKDVQNLKAPLTEAEVQISKSPETLSPMPALKCSQPSNEDECTLPIDNTLKYMETANIKDDNGIDVDDDKLASDNDDDDKETDDEILKNIQKSNERLAQELAKMPPLPKLTTSFSKKSKNEHSVEASNRIKTATRTATKKCGHYKPRPQEYALNSSSKEEYDSNNDYKRTSAIPCVCSSNGSTSKHTKNTTSTTKSKPFYNNNTRKHTYNSSITPTNTPTASHEHKHEFTLDTHLHHHHHLQHHHQQQQHESEQPQHHLVHHNCKAFSAYNNHQHRSHAATYSSHDEALKNTDSTRRETTCRRQFSESDEHLRVPYRSRSRDHALHRHLSTCHDNMQHCQTEPLPWVQQHLVLKQTVSSRSTSSKCERFSTSPPPPCPAQSQSTRQADILTVNTDSAVETQHKHERAACHKHADVGGTTLSATLKPKLYFEELLHRSHQSQSASSSCHSKKKTSRPPVKVDVNVRLVPKQSKATVEPEKVNSPHCKSALNETFVKEIDDFANALNETFVKEDCAATDLLHSATSPPTMPTPPSLPQSNLTFVKTEDDSVEAKTAL